MECNYDATADVSIISSKQHDFLRGWS